MVTNTLDFSEDDVVYYNIWWYPNFFSPAANFRISKNMVTLLVITWIQNFTQDLCIKRYNIEIHKNFQTILTTLLSILAKSSVSFSYFNLTAFYAKWSALEHSRTFSIAILNGIYLAFLSLLRSSYSFGYEVPLN